MYILIILLIAIIIVFFVMRHKNSSSEGKYHSSPGGKQDFSAHNNITSNETKKVEVLVSDEPDAPHEFGYKEAWLAIKSDDPVQVMDALQYENPMKANWETGLSLTDGGGYIFVSPVINGYVLVVGVGEFDGLRKTLDGIAKMFEEVQYFGTHRVVEYHCWAKYANGRLLRAYGYSGESGEVLINEGDLTQEEEAFGFDAFPKSTDDIFNDDNLEYPDEESVIKIAAAWGVDTSFPEEGEASSAGYVCRVHNLDMHISCKAGE